MEYDYAVSSGVPVLGFVHADPSEIPVGASELDPATRTKLDAFRAKVMSRMVKTYRTPDELASVVSRGLIRAIKQNPRPGWVRGDQALTDAVRAEIAELRAALAEAERRTSVAQGSAGYGIDTSFEHGDDAVELVFTVEHGRGYPYTQQEVEMEYTWDEIVELIGPSMLDEASESKMRKVVADSVRRKLLAASDLGWDKTTIRSAVIDDESWGHVLVQLRALGVIVAGQKKRTVSDKAVYWTLTPAGDNYLVRLKATKRSPSTSVETLAGSSAAAAEPPAPIG